MSIRSRYIMLYWLKAGFSKYQVLSRGCYFTCFSTLFQHRNLGLEQASKQNSIKNNFLRCKFNNAIQMLSLARIAYCINVLLIITNKVFKTLPFEVTEFLFGNHSTNFYVKIFSYILLTYILRICTKNRILWTLVAKFALLR